MKKCLYIILFLISLKSFSQSNSCRYFFGMTDNYPMVSSEIYGHYLCENPIADDKYKIIARSKNPMVFAINSGKIQEIFTVDSDKTYKNSFSKRS